MNALHRELVCRLGVHATSRRGFPSVNADKKFAAFQVLETAAIFPSLNL